MLSGPLFAFVEHILTTHEQKILTMNDRHREIFDEIARSLPDQYGQSRIQGGVPVSGALKLLNRLDDDPKFRGLLMQTVTVEQSVRSLPESLEIFTRKVYFYYKNMPFQDLKAQGVLGIDYSTYCRKKGRAINILAPKILGNWGQEFK